MVEVLLERPWVSLVGAIDIDKNKIGKDVGQLLQTPRNTGVIVSDKATDVLKRTSPDTVTHATSSYMKIIDPQLVEIIEQGANVVLTAEELPYHFDKYPDLARDLHDRAKRKDVVVLGTGVNPGFLLDTLVVSLSGVCQKVNSIRAERMVDASRRRLPLQKKIGAGLSTEEFEGKVKEGTIKHVGLPESVGLIALAMGWKVGEIQEGSLLLSPRRRLAATSSKFLLGSWQAFGKLLKGFLRDRSLWFLTCVCILGQRALMIPF